MKFIDEATISVQSGNGGRGCISFRRERFIPRGGPNGGDGGRGGDVIFSAASQKRTLYHFHYRRQFKAQSGTAGQASRKTGKNGKDLFIEVPPGTLIIDLDTGQLLKDLSTPEETFLVAKGGRGGQGNARFKSATNRTPRFAQPGEPGQTVNIKLELKLLADVGIIGLPNAGKSTLISVISSARPKIGDYPFTTLTPTLGVVKTGDAEPFVVADIPGLIEGAHAGAGLGIRFLRHIERTRVLVHLIDALSIDPDAPLGGYETINRELAKYHDTLAQKPQIVVLTKLDVPEANAGVERFRAALTDKNVLLISAVTGAGIDELIHHMTRLLDNTHENR